MSGSSAPSPTFTLTTSIADSASARPFTSERARLSDTWKSGSFPFVAPLLLAIVFRRGHVTVNKHTHAARRFCRRFPHCSFLRITFFFVLFRVNKWPEKGMCVGVVANRNLRRCFSMFYGRHYTTSGRFYKARIYSCKALKCLPRRHSRRATPAWQTCRAGMANVPCRRGR